MLLILVMQVKVGSEKEAAFNTPFICNKNWLSEASPGKVSSLSSHVFSLNTSTSFTEHFRTRYKYRLRYEDFG